MIGGNKSVGPDGIPGAILKMCGEVMIPYLALLLDRMINNGTTPRHWKKNKLSCFYSQRRRSFGSQKLWAFQFNLSGTQTNGTRHSRLYTTSVGIEGLVIRGTTWLQTGILVRSQIITVCQDISDSLDEAARLDAIIIDFSKAFDLVPHDRLLKKNRSLGRGFKGGRMD